MHFYSINLQMYFFFDIPTHFCTFFLFRKKKGKQANKHFTCSPLYCSYDTGVYAPASFTPPWKSAARGRRRATPQWWYRPR